MTANMYGRFNKLNTTNKARIVIVHATQTKTKTQTITAVPKSSTQAPPPPTTQAPATTQIVVVPTPVVHTCPTPGTYTFPATTVTVTATTTVCGATSTKVPSGTHTVGGVTTVVVTATTVTCPVATVHTSGTVTTSTIVQTTYVCPSAGTYTIAPITTTVSEETVIVYPTPTSYNPGTYTAPEQVITVTKTDYTYVCPLSSKGLPTTTPAPAPAPVKTQAPPPPPAKPSSAPKQSPPTTNNGGLTSNNDRLGITYTPYEPSNGACKSASQVETDIALIKNAGFTLVRVYSTDCNTLDNVGSACVKHGLNMITGVFVKATGCSIDTPDIKEQVDKLAAWNNWNRVKLLVIGNEAIMNNFCTPSQLEKLVVAVKGKLSGKYNGPCSISETLNIWQRKDVSSVMCPLVDIAGANVHAYFNSGVAPSDAGAFVEGQLNILSKICNKPTISLETGWPKDGNANGLAIAGANAQAEAIKSIRSKCGNKVVFFSFENDSWKQPGECNCEKSWGLAASFNIEVSV